ncbi:fluoride efflux transporter FluC [Ectobacillus sp. sgz5001026]|uniref:fluoride efflux transporter FluC n=1 Tax=Ectobacillus sp. sgz5001026 TaxID=3242473 RepID=UPI0036D2F456
MTYILVGVAGIVGALLRYSVGLIMANFSLSLFSTWFVNMIGCFFLALFTASIFKMKGKQVYFAPAIGTGLIGSFTTFSAFSVETVQFLHQHNYNWAFLYIGVSSIGGLMMAWVGLQLGNKLWKSYGQEEQQ